MIVRHPLFPEVQRDVRDPARWVQAGWVPVVPPLPPRPKPHPRPANRPKSSSRPRRATSAASDKSE